MLYFPHSTSVVSFYIDVVLVFTLSIAPILTMMVGLGSLKGKTGSYRQIASNAVV